MEKLREEKVSILTVHQTSKICAYNKIYDTQNDYSSLLNSMKKTTVN